MSKSFPSDSFMDASVADAGHELERLIQIMAQLRDPETGCAWDVQQTPATVAPYAIEEAYEVADAIEREAWDETADELGDLLLQVVFQSRIAEEKERFDFAEVTRRIADKMVRRHPHVFGEAQDIGDDKAALTAQWEQNKEQERQKRSEHGALAGIPLALPALLRASKLASRAARVGFDWPRWRRKSRPETRRLFRMRWAICSFPSPVWPAGLISIRKPACVRPTASLPVALKPSKACWP